MAVGAAVAGGREDFETAAAHASSRGPVVSPGDSAGSVRAALVGRSFESATHIAVCEGGRFRGLVRVEDLLAAPPDATAAGLMDAEAPLVAPGVDQEIAAWQAVRRGESALAVGDRDGRFVGLIPPHRLLAVLLSEHEEDLARVGGFLKQTSQARISSEEAVRWRFWHRVPWLLVGLAGAFVAADIVGSFEAQLRATVMLAFFVPGVVYLADAVGTQTETVVVRGLSVGVALRRMLARELLTGVSVGLALALVAYLALWWRWGRGDLALAVSLSLAAACSLATAIAMALPWLFDRLGRDPAFGSGPLATVVQDLLSILLYFWIAAAIVR